MNIVYLADHPQHIPTLAAWHHDQWGALSESSSLEKREASLRQDANYCQIPTAFVAIETDETGHETVLGSASLIENDLTTRPELTPWLASVYVDQAHRRKGVGSRVVQRIMEEAATLGFETLYLITPDQQNFYTHLGWSELETVHYRGEDVTIMRTKMTG